MAHHRKLVGAAAALNAVICVGEAIAGLESGSLSLVMDSIHNLSDELALVFLFLAFLLPRGLSRNLVRSANLLNSVGLLLVSGLLVWYAIQRLMAPAPVLGIVLIVVGLFAAAANWGVARLLLLPSEKNPAIRLAYLHNQGDVLVSLAPVLAGLLVTIFDRSFFDPLFALLIAGYFIWSTVKEIIGSRKALIWPDQMVCDHGSDEAIGTHHT